MFPARFFQDGPFEVHVRLFHENLTVFEPADIGVEVELRLLGLEKVPLEPGLHCALEEYPSGPLIKAGIIGTNVVASTLQHDVAKGFDELVVMAGLCPVRKQPP